MLLTKGMTTSPALSGGAAAVVPVSRRGKASRLSVLSIISPPNRLIHRQGGGGNARGHPKCRRRPGTGRPALARLRSGALTCEGRSSCKEGLGERIDRESGGAAPQRGHARARPGAL